MKKRIFSIMLCLVFLCTAALGADFTYGKGTAFSVSEILLKFTKILKNEGVTPDYMEDEAAEFEEGFVYVAADAFVLGGGYVMEPAKIRLMDGDTAASVLIRALRLNDIYAEYDGDERNDFYLRKIGGINFTPKVEAEFEEWIKNAVTYYEPENIGGMLGEFDVTDMSGWLYSVNGEIANISMSDYEVTDGDVIIVRYSLAWGMDIGEEAFGDVEKPYTEAVDFSGVTKAIANGQLSWQDCENVLNKASVSEEEINELLQDI